MPPYRVHDGSPASTGKAVAKSDSVDETTTFSYLQNGNTAGNISFISPGSDTAVVQYVAAGGFIWCAVKRVNSTGTVAGVINGYY